MVVVAMDEDALQRETPYTDQFILRGVLGAGGIGRVYLAYEKNLGREVAIKELILPYVEGESPSL